jgi:hypothetical protein
MKRNILLAAFLLVSFATQAQYMKKDVWELAAGSDLVIQGKITQAQQGLPKITLTIEDVISGTFEGTTIEFGKFINTKMAKRWAKYAEGEGLIVFLKLVDDKYEIIGEGGEGEKLVMSEEVYLDGRGGALWNKFTYHPLQPTGQIYAEKVNLAEFKAAVKEYKACFEVVYQEETIKGFELPQQVPHARQICDDKALDVYRGLSFIADKLAELSLATAL